MPIKVKRPPKAVKKEVKTYMARFIHKALRSKVTEAQLLVRQKQEELNAAHAELDAAVQRMMTDVMEFKEDTSTHRIVARRWT